MTSAAPKRTVPAALQRQLPVADPRLRVLVTINGAREREAFRNYDEDDILWLIENAYLVAFDISLRAGKDSSARELRIFPDSLDYYAKTNGNPKAKKNPFAATWDRLILSNDTKPFLLSTRAQVILNCGSTHVTNLIDAGHLKQLAGTEYKVGRNGAACISRDSFLAFLKSRLEGAC
jgi:hypothetical protein